MKFHIIHSPGHPDYDPAAIEQWKSTWQEGYVYLLKPVDHNVYKIGCTTDLDRRMKQYKRKYKFQVEYVASLFYDNYQHAEQRWQSKFNKYKLSGEWFVLPDAEVQLFIEGML